MKNIFTLRALIITSLITVPLIASAQGLNAEGGLIKISDLVDTFTGTVVRSVGTLLATMAMVAFFYGIVQFIWGTREGKPDVMTKGKNFMLWGLIALFVMFSVWGIVQYVQNIFGIQGANVISIPSIQFRSSGGLPTGGSSLPSSGFPTGVNTQSTIYTTPSGSGVQLGGGSNNPIPGGDCTVDAECPSSLTCSNYICQ
ncbi:MAG: hypothetical protein WCT07_02460 [Candidatus Paceibacterota bacterium]|jgi:hypothetical protein